MNVRLEITISIETLRQLSRDDLQGTDIVGIERAREKHLWVNQLFEELSSQASAFLYQYYGRVLFHSLLKKPDEIFEKASKDIFTDAQGQIDNFHSGLKISLISGI